MVCWADDTCVQLDLEINNLCNDVYIYVHVFMRIVIIIRILYRKSIVMCKILSDHDMHQQCDPKHSYPPASCLIHI